MAEIPITPWNEGERWTIVDQLDATTMMTFDSWSYFDPEGRAREAYDSYPRPAYLWRERVVKFERVLMEHPDPVVADGKSNDSEVTP